MLSRLEEHLLYNMDNFSSFGCIFHWLSRFSLFFTFIHTENLCFLWDLLFISIWIILFRYELSNHLGFCEFISKKKLSRSFPPNIKQEREERERGGREIGECNRSLVATISSKKYLNILRCRFSPSPPKHHHHHCYRYEWNELNLNWMRIEWLNEWLKWIESNWMEWNEWAINQLKTEYDDDDRDGGGGI